MNYVLADIHGQQDRFNKMLDLINLQPTDTLYILGDVIDRHPDGIQILKQIIHMPNVKMSLGNHEDMMSNALRFYLSTNPRLPISDIEDENLFDLFDHWFANGGRVTFESFMAQSPEEQEEILDYIDSLPLEFNLEVNGTKFILVHAAPVESFYPMFKYDTPHDHALWYRDIKYLPRRVEETVVFGHTRTKNFQDNIPQCIWHHNNLIGIDCGCASKDKDDSQLACLRLDDMQEFYVQ